MKADKTKVTNLLKTVRGQVEGIMKMIEDDRYCIDISHQLMATQAMIAKANREGLSAHIKSCILEAKDGAEREEKIDEMVELISKLIK